MYIKLMIFFLIIIFCFGFNLMHATKKCDGSRVLKLAVYPVGCNDETYIISVKENGEYNVQFGEKENAKEKEIKIIKIKKEKTIQLSRKDLIEIKILIDELKKEKILEKGNVIKGGWELLILIDKIKINIYLNRIEEYNRSLNKLIKKLFELSPIKIDIHSWS